MACVPVARIHPADVQSPGRALEHLMDVVEDVPLNIQQLANISWEELRASGGGTLTTARVDAALSAW